MCIFRAAVAYFRNWAKKTYGTIEKLREAWNDPAIGIVWPDIIGDYSGSASAEGYMLEDGTKLNLSDKDQKWDGIELLQ